MKRNIKCLIVANSALGVFAVITFTLAVLGLIWEPEIIFQPNIPFILVWVSPLVVALLSICKMEKSHSDSTYHQE